MSLVHHVPCSPDTPPAEVGVLARALVAVALGGAPPPARVRTDSPVRARSQEQWEAWTAPLREAAVAGGEGLLLLTRGTLHARSGFEGAVHALAVGGATPAEKAALQEGLQPKVDRDLCGGCGMCVALCGNRGVRHNGHIAVVQAEHCLACGDCLAECFPEALIFPEGGSARLMERLAAAAAVDAGRRAEGLASVLFLLPEPERRLTLSGRHVRQPAVGLLCGDDPVAVDQAALDLIVESLGASVAEITSCPANPLSLNEMAESQGVGSRGYALRTHAAADLAPVA